MGAINLLNLSDIYSALWKYSPPWHFSYFVALQPGIKTHFLGRLYPLIYTTCTTLWRCKIFFIVKQARNKTKKQTTWACITIHPPKSILCRANLCSNYSCKSLGVVSISLAHLATGISAHSSWQNCSSSFKLDGFRRCTAIFKSYHRFSIGLRSGL